MLGLKLLILDGKVVKADLSLVRSKSYAHPVETAMTLTGTILTSLGNIGVPVVGALGGALKVGGLVLNPPAKLADLKNQSEDIEKALENANGAVKEALESKLKIVQDQIKAEADTMTDHYATLQVRPTCNALS